MPRMLSPGTLFPFLQSGLGKSWLICCPSRSADRLLPGLPTNLRLSFLRKFGPGVTPNGMNCGLNLHHNRFSDPPATR
jgi:hypothetical protein